MGIFSSIKKAIFGDKGPLGGQFGGGSDAPAAPTGTATSGDTSTIQPAPTPAADVDVDAVLADMYSTKGEDLNYKTSIVDLMKLLDLDPSLANRKELAEELGYTGERDGSAEMNIWLHKAVMQKLEENGGRVSFELMN